MFDKMPKQPPQLKVSLSQLEDITCECGSKVFMPALRFKKLSAILSPTGQEQISPLETMICVNCRRELAIIKNAVGG